MKKSALVLAISSVVLSGAVFAEDTNTYVEIGYTTFSDEDTVNGQAVDIDLGVGTLGLGYQMHPNFAIEGFIGTGMKDDSVTISGITIDAELNNVYGVYLKPSAEITDNVSIFAKLGYVWYEVEASVPGTPISVTGDEDDASYGVGVQFDITDSAYVGASYMAFGDADGFNLGLGMKF